jgi:hypothetical protein
LSHNPTNCDVIDYVDIDSVLLADAAATPIASEIRLLVIGPFAYTALRPY